jgi:RimJ/RimL family protein N-acetyltransferase
MIFKPLTLPAEWDWMQQRARPVCCEDSQGIVAYQAPGVIAACCVLDGFTAHSCNAHLAIDNPLAIRAGFLTEVFQHVFGVCGLQRMFGLVPANNQKALKFNLKIGFTEAARIPDGFETGVDYVVVRMDKYNCRWYAPVEMPVSVAA